MNFDPGTIIAVAAALLFYLRLIILQRQKIKTMRETSASHLKNKRRKAGTPPPITRPGLVIANKFLVFGGAALLILGAAIAGVPAIDSSLRSAWWLPVTFGILLMGIGIR